MNSRNKSNDTEKNENKNDLKSIRHRESCPKREIHSNTGNLKKQEKSQIKNYLGVVAASAAVSAAAGTEVPATAAWVAGRPRAGSAGARSHGGLHRDLGRQRLRELGGHPLGPGAEAPPGPVPDPRRVAPPDRGLH